MKMLKYDIADKKYVELVEKFMKAGIMENGKYFDRERGTLQGNGTSYPIYIYTIYWITGLM